MKDYSDVSWKYLSIPALAGRGESSGYRQLAYTDWGDPKNRHVIICAHGLTRNCRDFDFFADSLKEDFRVVCVDMAGRGRSDWLENPEDYNSPLTYLSDMEHVLEYIHLQNDVRIQFYWVGISMGGLVGMLMTTRKCLSGAFRALVVSDIGPFVSSRVLAQFATYTGKAPRFNNLGGLESYMRDTALPYSALTDAQWHHQAVYSAREYGDGTIGFRYDPGILSGFQPGNMNDIDLWACWDKLTFPVLVIRGGESGVLTPGTAREMQLRRPEAHIVELAGVGHAPMLMNTEQIHLVRNFLLKSRSYIRE